METHTQLYEHLCSMGNLTLAWRNARKGKTTKADVVAFDKEVTKNLVMLHDELMVKTYQPRPLVNFILRDPKTRKISKSDFRDRIVHHAVLNILRPIFEKTFIYDSCAGRLGKGTLFALRRFDLYIRKVTRNKHQTQNRFHDTNFVKGYCLKADIKHYFQEVNHGVLMRIIAHKIHDHKVLWLIKQILENTYKSYFGGGASRGKACHSVIIRHNSSQMSTLMN